MSDDGPSAPGYEDLAEVLVGYELGELIAENETSSTHRAKDERLDREVVVFRLLPHPETSEDDFRRFFSTAAETARLRHENLVRGYDVGKCDPRVYFVAEYAPGTTVEQLLTEGPLGEAKSLRILRDMARALDYLGQCRVRHGHLRAANIMVHSKGYAKLCDTGIMKEIVAPSRRDYLLSRPDCANPEALHESDEDIRSDLYSLGCVFYRMLTGRAPFRGVRPENILESHLHEEPEPPREVKLRLSQASSRIALWLLAKSREDRPRSPRELLDDLSEHPKLSPEEEEPTSGEEAEALPGEENGSDDSAWEETSEESEDEEE